MKDWHDVQEILSRGLVDFLGESLPEIGGVRWWQHYVVDQLTPNQARLVSDLRSGDLQSLDFAALLRVAERNWSEFVFKRQMMRDARALLGELKVARNRYAHAPVSGVPVEDRLRDVDTALRFLKALGAEKAVLGPLDAIRRKLLVEMASAPSEDEEEDEQQRPGSFEGQPRLDEPSGPGASKPPSARPEGTESIAPEVVQSSELPRAARDGRWVVDPRSNSRDIQRAVQAATFVGIDFGTSTSVVSVIVQDANGRMASRTLDIDQPDQLGGTISHHLVNTVLAWIDDRVIFGRDAYRLRQELFEGRNVFSSFKMRLGVDVGPTYPETALPRGGNGPAIEDATDATREFFGLLSKSILAAVKVAGLPEELRFAVTVPASFEANQRRDLLNCMRDAGLPVTASCLIDEPNAAFLSFLHASANDDADRTLVERLMKGPAQVLVYDFGAGTCDVSILEVDVGLGKVSSRNRAISRFTALGGDDFDRAIAREVLLPQMLVSAPGFEPDSRDIDERLVPRLQPAAERLKVAAIKWLSDRGVTRLSEVRAQDCAPFVDLAVPTFRIRGQTLGLQAPTLSLGQLADTMEPFVDRFDPDVSTAHVFAPVADAIEKSGLSADEIDAVLFIGGSAANPIVRTAVMAHLPRSVVPIVPKDLRSHVSLGAAIHSLGFHAFGFDLIRPITSEPIYVVTRGGRLETVIPASSEVPTQTRFQTRLQIQRSGQHTVELPICVSNESKLLGLLRLEAPDDGDFQVGEEVLVTAGITHEKLLDIDAHVAGIRVEAALLNPLANKDLTPAETRMLEAKQDFNASLLKHRGRPPKDVVLKYARAALEAEAFDIAAEMFIAAERIDPDDDHATSISYAYSRAARPEKSKEWAVRAHERRPNATTAYNLSCDAGSDLERERLLRESLRMSSGYAPALLALGLFLRARGDGQGDRMLEKCVSLLDADLRNHEISKDGCRSLIRAAEAVGASDVLARAKARLESMSSTTSAYAEENLAAAIGSAPQLARG